MKIVNCGVEVDITPEEVTLKQREDHLNWKKPTGLHLSESREK